MDKYTELKEIVSKLSAMNEDNKSIYDYILNSFEKENVLIVVQSFNILFL